MFPFGVDYYPEHWPEERWPEDVRLMLTAGINTVRLAEFAWSRLEPSENCFDFAWLDRAVDLLAENGIQIILGTPTASAPPWLMNKDVTQYRVDAGGTRMTYGHRREYCPSHPLYRRHSESITLAMAQHYRDHPAIIGWQIDNELMNRCYCDICRQGFHTWLEAKYKTLRTLNEAWGTVFWSHVYTAWDEIPVPLTTGTPHNPGLALDYLRFASDVFVDYQKLQLDILREHCPGRFITHNFMGFGFKEINYFDLAKDLDLVTWDSYPRGFWNRQPAFKPSDIALGHDTMRGLKGKPFWMMEQQSGPGGWDTLGVTPRPGEVRLWAYQAVAHGADGMIFFRWRTARYGAEQFWHGLLNHDGSTGRRFEEVKQMGLELQASGDEILGSSVQAEVATLLSYDTRFAFEVQANHPDFSYPEHFGNVYQSFYDANVAVDIVPPDADLSAYKVVVAPALYVLDTALATKLEVFVNAGGTLLATARTGVKDVANAVVDTPLPGLLANLFGVTVEDYDAPPAEVSQALEFHTGTISANPQARARLWFDVLSPTAAEVVATYTDDYYQGKPAVTLNEFGEGKAVYVGTFGNVALYKTLAPWLLSLAGVSKGTSTPSGVEVVERKHEGKTLRFILNHADTVQQVEVSGRDLLTGAALEGLTDIAPKDLVIIVTDSAAGFP